MWAHRNGFMYYTPDMFRPDSIDQRRNVTTGYIDRRVYDINPLTLDDFRHYLDDMNRRISNTENILEQRHQLSHIAFNNVYNMLALVRRAMDNKICSQQNGYQLFGADVAIDDQLKAQLMEINKQPDLTAKDDRDKKVKKMVLTDMLAVLGVIDAKNHDFIEL